MFANGCKIRLDSGTTSRKGKYVENLRVFKVTSTNIRVA